MTGKKIAAFLTLFLATIVASFAAETNSPPVLEPMVVTILPNIASSVLGKKNVIEVGKPSISIERTKNPRNVIITIRGEPGKTYILVGDCKVPTNRILSVDVMPPEGKLRMSVGFPTSD